MILVLVLVGLAYARRQVTNAGAKAATATVLNGPIYAVLLAVAVLLAFLWH